MPGPAAVRPVLLATAGAATHVGPPALAPQRHAQRAPILLHRLHGVAKEVEHDLLDLIRVDPDLGQFGVEVARDGDLEALGIVSHQRQRALDAARQAVLGQLRGWRAREAKQAVHDAVEAGRFLQDDLGEAATRVVLGEPLEQELRARGDPGQRVADLVGHSRREFAERGQTFLAPRFLLGPLKSVRSVRIITIPSSSPSFPSCRVTRTSTVTTRPSPSFRSTSPEASPGCSGSPRRLAPPRVRRTSSAGTVEEIGRSAPEERLRRRVHVVDAPLRVHGDHRGAHRAQDPLGEAREVGQLPDERGLLETGIPGGVHRAARRWRRVTTVAKRSASTNSAFTETPSS